MSDKDVKGETPADAWLYRLCVAGLVVALAILAVCAVWPLVGGVTR